MHLQTGEQRTQCRVLTNPLTKSDEDWLLEVKELLGEPLTIHNDGRQIRSWCYIDDIVDGIFLAMGTDAAVGQSFNIGNPRSTVTIHQLAREIVRLSGSSSEIHFVPWNFPDVEIRIPSIDKARDLLGFKPEVDLEEGLLRTIRWYRDKVVAV